MGMETQVKLLVILSCYFIAAGAQENGDVRLMDGSVNTEGRVEIFLDGTWGTLRFNNDSNYYYEQEGAAQAICRQLGFQDQKYVSSVSNLHINPAPDSVPVLLRDVFCDFNPYPPNSFQHILRCQHVSDPTGTGHSDDMAVQCSNDYIYTPYDTDVQLVHGNTPYKSSGYLEVYLHGSWGPVCNLGQGDADSACRQLGYTYAIHHVTGLNYTGILSDNLDSFTCSSITFPCLRSCFYYPSVGDDITCSGHSYVTCTFDEFSPNSSGNEALCSTLYSSVVAVVVGVVVAILVLILCAVVICVAVCCCCIPGCIIHRSRRRIEYQTVQC